jgi:HSP20 family protein
MPLIKWQPKRNEADPVHSLREVVDRMFDTACWRAPQPWGPTWLSPQSEFFPNVDIRETGDEYLVVAEVPGLSREDLSVHITEESVTIRGERRGGEESKGENYHYKESTYGSFQRVIPLPGPVLPDQSTAKLKDGVLTLRLRKAEPTKQLGIRVPVEE